MTLQSEKQTIAMHVLPNLTKFDQFIEYNMRHFSVIENLFSDPFLKNQDCP